MNFNHIFAPTATAERFIKGHAANLGTYALIAAVVFLTGISAALSFVADHLERREEYRIIAQLAIVKA